jgi:hypothetical protein
MVDSIELLFYINVQTENVSIRQPKQKETIDLLKFAQKYCDGNGTSNSAGGKITPLFMELTKNLNPL